MTDRTALIVELEDIRRRVGQIASLLRDEQRREDAMIARVMDEVRRGTHGCCDFRDEGMNDEPPSRPVS
jgi:hypothetical protein